MARSSANFRMTEIDLIPSTWDIVPFGEICESSAFGPRFSGDMYDPQGNVATLRTTDLDDNGRISYSTMPLARLDLNKYGKHLLQANDLVITRSGTCGIAAVFEDFRLPVLPGAFSIRFRLSTRGDPRFFRYYFNSPIGRERVLALASGSVQQNLNSTSLLALKVPLPPLSEQRAIVHILGALDDKIELNRRMNHTLEEMARAIFKSWFVDFGPVVAKAEGRQPYGMNAETAALFPSAFQDSELGPIPKEWQVGTVGDEFNLTMGQSPPGKTYNEGGEGIPFYQGRTDFGFRFPTRCVYCTAPTRFANPGDTLVSVRAPVGDINMASEHCSVGRGVAALRHKSGSRSYTYYSMHFMAEEFSVFEGEGTLFGSIGGDSFRGIKVIVLDPRTIVEFERRVFPLDQSIENNEHQSATLAAIRDALLPKLLSGEIRVNQVAETQ